MTADTAIAAVLAAAADAVSLQASQREDARAAAPDLQPARPDPPPGTDPAAPDMPDTTATGYGG